MQCSRCKKSYDIGDYPFCPHEAVKPGPSRYFRFENYVDGHVAPQPIEVTSPGHRDRLMKEHALVERPREHIDDLNSRRASKGLPPVRDDGTGYAS